MHRVGTALAAGARVRALLVTLLLAGCTAPECELLEAERRYPATPDIPFEMFIVLDGTPASAADRTALEAAWRHVLDHARHERDDGQAAYLYEHVRIRFLAPAPGCAPPECDARSSAEWTRFSPARDDVAFEAQALCLWRSTPACGENRPIDALLSALRTERYDPRALLTTVIVSSEDDASSIDPRVAASELVALGDAARLHVVSVAAGAPADPTSCGWALDASTVPRLAAFADALLAIADRVEASAMCGERTDPRALGGDGVSADYQYRRSFALVRDERGAVDCEVEETLPPEGPVARCSEAAHLGRSLLRVDPDGREVCTIEQRPARDGPGWYHEPDLFELRFVSGSQPMPDASLTLRCRSAARACTTDEDCVPSLADPSHPRFVRCDPEHGVCVFACDDECDWPGDTCERIDPDLRGWCAPAPVCE